MTNKNKIIKRWLPAVLCLIFFTAPLFADEPEAVNAVNTAAYEIEALLNNSEVTYGQAARFILEASDMAVYADAEEAFLYLAERNWLPKNATSGQIARLDVLSGVFMKAFDIKGGLFYSLTGGSHYAYRELVYLNIIQGKTEPAMKVSGELLLFISGRLLSFNQTGVVQ